MKPTIVMFLFFMALACKKNEGSNSEPGPPGDTINILGKRSFIIDSLAIINASDNSVSLKKNNATSALKVGDIIIANPSAAYVYGFMRKIVAVEVKSSEIDFSTEQASLNAAFDQLYINSTYLDTFYSSETFRTGPKLSVKFSDNNTIAPGIKLSGELIFNIPSVHFEYEKKQGSLKSERMLLKAEINTDGSTIEISNDENSAIQIGEKILTKFDLPVFYVPIPIPTQFGIVVVRVPMAHELSVRTLPITISGKAKWATLPKMSATLGVKYEDFTWTNLSTWTIHTTASPFVKTDFASIGVTAEMKFLTLEYELVPFKISPLKIFFAIPNTFNLTVQTASPNYSLKYKLDVTGGVKQEFFTGVKQEYSLTGNIVTQTILEGDWEDSTIPDTVQVGNQIWMTKNLDVANYRNGDPIPQVQDSVAWSKLTTGAWCYYENEGQVYGKLYNFYAVNDPRGLAPNGWHVPKASDWQILHDFFGGYEIAGGKLKEAGFAHWKNPNLGADNSSGFTALPGGFRHSEGGFNLIKESGFWWIGDMFPSGFDMHYNSPGIYIAGWQPNYGLSVRCIKD